MPDDGVQPKVEAYEDETTLNRPAKVEEVEPNLASTTVKIEEMEDGDGPRLRPGDFATMPLYPDLRRSVSPAAAEVDGDDDLSFGGMPAIADFNDSDDDDTPDLDAPKPHTKLEDPSCSMPSPAPPVKQEQDDFDEDEGSQWGSLNQLVAFRETSVAIGQEYLKAQGIKLGKGRAISRLEIKDSEAHGMYVQGIQDAKKIDVRGRRLKGAEQD